MSIPYPKITKIPETEPDAVPSLWNETYEEIDANFKNLEERVTEGTETLISPSPTTVFLEAYESSDGNSS